MSASMSISTLLLTTLLLSVPLPALASDPACTCYQSTSNDFFTSYAFHDFRLVSDYGGRTPSLSSNLPSTADDSTGISGDDIGTLQSGFIASSNQWNDSWSIQQWGKGKADDTKYRMWNALSNVFIDKNTDGTKGAKTKLVLRTKRFGDWQSSAEVENKQKNLLYATTRFRARVKGASGAVAGLFYFRNNQNESDIEILTRDQPSKIRYSNQPVLDKNGNEIKDASTLVDLNSLAQVDGTALTDKRSTVSWEDWHTHRIDWVAGKSSWYVDGKLVLEKTYSVPTIPSYLTLNMWSDGGMWSGEMKPGHEAKLEIEWIEMAYNTTDTTPTRRKRAVTQLDCKVTCKDNSSDSGVLNGGWQKVGITSAGKKRIVYGFWSGTDDREFAIATAIGATMAVVLYIVDNVI
ncbi:concanavalin A-like lectin/glucanase domain-containing protein [Pyronema domesticum]|uniref:Similar to Beta-glucanase acc. no. P23904 n=1 Tax=Pyronema omphalodes (strain CBS 100304) TaxID=1076935 RepID=U4L0D5_PYROM|nr:concanavalin A-like lectin/glucanase domain-containing protein [Pyronema domesticum]CCX08486.1 Similar to Beta-glucanase; acc. no. P23904 [Pyronema omphalodes CBS 100304]